MKWFWTLLVGSLVTLTLMFLLMQQWGQLQVYEEFAHPFFKGLPPQTRATIYNETLPKDSWTDQLVVWVDLRSSQDGILFHIDNPLSGQRMAEIMGAWPSYVGEKPQLYKFADLKKFFPEAKSFTDLCQEAKPQRWILNLVDNSQDLHLAIVNAVESCGLQERALIQSTTTSVLGSVRYEKPRWLFGFSRADLNRIITFSSVGLGSMAPIKGDVFVSPITLLGRKILDKDVLAEAQRRKMKIVLGPVTNEDEMKFITENQLPFDLLVQESPHSASSPDDTHHK